MSTVFATDFFAAGFFADGFFAGGVSATVPDVVGLDAASAVTAIEAEGLVASAASDYSGTVALGDVISQSPIAGATVAAGSTVVYIVSLGPQPPSDGSGISASIRRNRRRH